MKNVDYSKFYGERFCLKCERLLQEDQIHIHVCQNPDTPDISFLKTKTFECKECRPRQLARKFDYPFWRFIKVYFLRFVIPFGLGIIIVIKAFEDLDGKWLLIPVSLLFFGIAFIAFFMPLEKKEIKLLIQKIASK